LRFLDSKHSKFEFGIEKIMRTIITKTNSCMRATTAVERIEVRRDIIWVPRFVRFFERAGCNHNFGLLGGRSDATKLYLEVLRD
jgi:hypothetical protein